jgi:hypothetical protein
VDTLNNSRQNMQLVSVKTDHLRERLNKLYDVVRGNPKTYSYWGRFDYLWDLKELAMLEGKGNVHIPDSWLDELERVYVEFGDIKGRGH